MSGMETSPAPRSALEENIQVKGKNSYYYAHAGNLGQGADKKCVGEAPRLLSRSESKSDGAETKKKLITDYAWSDCGAKVRVYITLSGLESIDNDSISVQHTETSANLKISGLNGRDHILNIPKLNSEITKATAKKNKKDTKVIMYLTKKEEFTWYDLKKD